VEARSGIEASLVTKGLRPSDEYNPLSRVESALSVEVYVNYSSSLDQSYDHLSEDKKTG
jgi:hypothetical protein